jgi:hypothetical protein
VSKFLGHSNLGTTTRYLNATRRGLHLAVEKLENARLAKTLQAQQTQGNPPERLPKKSVEISPLFHSV